MKKYIFTILFQLSFILLANAQWTGTNPISTNSNVGIGTTNPSAKLDVNGDANFSGKLEHSNKKYCNTLIGDNYVKIYQISTKSSQLASNLRISATSHTGGHVGNFTANILVNHYKDVFIKTISGAYTQGTIKIESDNNGNYFMSYKTTSSNAARYYFTIEALSSELTITPLPTGEAPTQTVHAHETNFGTHESGTGGNLNSIYSGNVGIGTTSPAYKLDVYGTISAIEIKVEAKTADYIFEEDFKLRSLEEVENFVKENKHLPEIASAKEMEEHGVFQSEMNQKLLQKIEELTLYMIEMNKRVNSLETENSALKEEINELKSL